MGLRVSAAIKNRIDADAHANGRTQSAQAELMLEKLYAYEATLAGMKVTLEEIEAGNVDVVQNGDAAVVTIDNVVGSITLLDTLASGVTWVI